MRNFEFVKRLSNTEGLKLPERSTTKSAGYDFYAIEDVIIPPYKLGDDPFLVATGIKVIMEDNEFLMLVNRSSMPKKKKLVIPNSLGVVDADYFSNPTNDGEMFFGFYNLSNEPVEIKKNERIGQGVFMKYFVTDTDNAQGNRIGGLGSTGK